MTTYAIIIFFSILVLHWIFDFIMQTDFQAKNKSRNIDALLGHTVTYSWCWVAVLFLFHFGYNYFRGVPLHGTFYNALLFGVITFTAHTLTDYCTSKIVKNYFERGNYHTGFVWVGFDQILHYVQLILTYYFIYEIYRL